MCNATVAIVYVIRRHIEQAVRKKKPPSHLQTLVRIHRTQTKTISMMNILALYMSMIELHIYMYDKIEYKLT